MAYIRSNGGVMSRKRYYWPVMADNVAESLGQRNMKAARKISWRKSAGRSQMRALNIQHLQLLNLEWRNGGGVSAKIAGAGARRRSSGAYRGGINGINGRNVA
jgi:hypothetical protein